jgi:hypothetical protein
MRYEELHSTCYFAIITNKRMFFEKRGQEYRTVLFRSDDHGPLQISIGKFMPWTYIQNEEVAVQEIQIAAVI